MSRWSGEGPPTAVIAGGTGALGRRVADDLAGHGLDVVVLTRSPRHDIGHRQVLWDGRTVGTWAAELEGAIVINLAGELVDRRPTRRNIEILRRSRVDPTRALVEAALTNGTPPIIWLQMSTLAIYGDAGQVLVDERHTPADGPPQMPGVARPWEAASEGAPAGRRVVLRTGLVLDRGTPAFERLATLTRMGLGGRIGRGDQWVSWIHVDDFLAAVRFVIDDGALSGIVHVTAPEPVTNAEMMGELRRTFGRRWAPPTPRALVHVGATLMGTDAALALTGRRCVPRRLLRSGFEFAHPTFADAVDDLVHAGPAVERTNP